MRFATRTFLWSFVPFAVLLMASFGVIQRSVVSTVRDGLRASLREKQATIAASHTRSELQNRRFLRIVGENSALKAGLHVVLANRGSAAARLPVEEQLRQVCEALRLDL